MKKVLFSIAILAVAFGFTACSNEDEALGNVKGEKTTVLAMTEVGTRTALESDGAGAYNVVWSEGDNIYIGNGHSEYYEFELKSGAGETAATFEATGKGTATGEVPADGNYKVYYGSQYDTFESNQHYEASKVSNFQMCASATVTDGKISPIQFWNVGGILRLTVKGTATIKNIKVTSEQPMSGPSSFNNETKTATASDYYSIKYVQLDCGDGVALTTEGTVFNIALLANDYTGVAITLTDTDGNTCTKTFKGTSLKIERSKITKASFTANIVPATTGKAKATIGGEEVDVNWVQLWAGGPKFAEYNVEGKITFEAAAKTGNDYVWGANWRTPSIDELNELYLAAKGDSNAKVKCKYDNSSGNFVFTGKEEGYTENTVLFHRGAGSGATVEVTYWSGTADGGDGRYLNLSSIRFELGASLGKDAQNQQKYVRPVLAK